MPDLNELLHEDAAAWRSEVDARRGIGALREANNVPRRPRMRRWRAPLVAGLVTVVVAFGLAYVSTRGPRENSDTALPRLSTAGTTRDPLNPVPSGQIAEARNRALPIPQTTATRGGKILSMHWRFLAMLDDGRTVLVSYEVGDGCDRPLGFRVEQGSNAVELAALSKVSNVGCTQPLLFGYGTVTLDRPLGSRALLHAATDRH